MDQKVKLDWTGVAEATGYKIHYGLNEGQYENTVDVGNVTAYEIGGLENDVPCYFSVQSYNGANAGEVSVEVTETPAVQEITYVSNITYTPSGQMDTITYGNGVITKYTYNSRLRVTNIRTYDTGGDIQNLTYTYDSVGNIKTITDSVRSKNQTFTYDEQNRLVTASNPNGYGSKTYAYNAIGNITQKDGYTYTYAEGGAGKHAVTKRTNGSETVNYTYDANGNMQTKQIVNGALTEYKYDIENRLTEVKKDSIIKSTYAYDGDGGRTEKVVNDENGDWESTTRFVGSLFEETIGLNAADRSHIFLGSTRIATLTDGEVRYYHMDHLGGTNVTTDADADVMQVIEYHPYGKDEIVVDNELSDSQRAWNQFTSHYKDSESGLIYMQARYYDYEIGAFITADTIVQDPKNPSTFNRYYYAGNNPVNNYDPDGHGWFKKFFKQTFRRAKKIIGKVVGAIVGTITFITSSFNPIAAFKAYNLTETLINGGLAISRGVSPFRVLASAGLSILLNELVPAPSIGFAKNAGRFAFVTLHTLRGTAISAATTGAVWGTDNLERSAIAGGVTAGIFAFLTPIPYDSDPIKDNDPSGQGDSPDAQRPDDIDVTGEPAPVGKNRINELEIDISPTFEPGPPGGGLPPIPPPVPPVLSISRGNSQGAINQPITNLINVYGKTQFVDNQNLIFRRNKLNNNIRS